MLERKKISQATQDKIITLSGRKCCLCSGINLDFDPKKGQIAHLDQNPENNNIDNLAWLCLNHHDEYDSTTRQSKGLTIGEVKQYRAELYEVVERGRQNALPTPKAQSTGKDYILPVGLVIVALVGLILWFLISSPGKDVVCDQPITTATATIEIMVASEEDINTTYITSGAYLAFGKGNEALLIMSSTQSTAKQKGDGRIIYRAIVNMDVSDTAFRKPIHSLQEAKYIQVIFLPMPEQSQILAGKITGIFNGETPLEIDIPAQEIDNGIISIQDLDINCGTA